MEDLRTHWEKVYRTKELTELSWYQPTPATTLQFIKEANLPKDAAIIDVGGGDSLLVDHLIDSGYTNLTVLDLSEASLQRAKERLQEKAKLVKWIVSDAAEFKPDEKYSFWHDRAVFHFFTDEEKIQKYLAVIDAGLQKNGTLMVGTFSENGPDKCSGLDIRQYSEESMTDTFSKYFAKVRCVMEDHRTPSGTIQNFVFCSFKRR